MPNNAAMPHRSIVLIVLVDLQCRCRILIGNQMPIMVLPDVLFQTYYYLVFLFATVRFYFIFIFQFLLILKGCLGARKLCFLLIFQHKFWRFHQTSVANNSGFNLPILHYFLHIFFVLPFGLNFWVIIFCNIKELILLFFPD